MPFLADTWRSCKGERLSMRGLGERAKSNEQRGTGGTED